MSSRARLLSDPASDLRRRLDDECCVGEVLISREQRLLDHLCPVFRDRNLELLGLRLRNAGKRVCHRLRVARQRLAGGAEDADLQSSRVRALTPGQLDRESAVRQVRNPPFDESRLLSARDGQSGRGQRLPLGSRRRELFFSGLGVCERALGSDTGPRRQIAIGADAASSFSAAETLRFASNAMQVNASILPITWTTSFATVLLFFPSGARIILASCVAADMSRHSPRLALLATARR